VSKKVNPFRKGYIPEELTKEGHRARMLLQIHDEPIFQSAEDNVAFLTILVKSDIEQAVPLDVPLTIDIGVEHSCRGNWSEIAGSN
jgi:DNA polymerase I-like protein with 3'-5' exonuclease and polymerase domains